MSDKSDFTWHDSKISTLELRRTENKHFNIHLNCRFVSGVVDKKVVWKNAKLVFYQVRYLFTDFDLFSLMSTDVSIDDIEFLDTWESVEASSDYDFLNATISRESVLHGYRFLNIRLFDLYGRLLFQFKDFVIEIED